MLQTLASVNSHGIPGKEAGSVVNEDAEAQRGEAPGKKPQRKTVAESGEGRGRLSTTLTALLCKIQLKEGVGDAPLL